MKTLLTAVLSAGMALATVSVPKVSAQGTDPITPEPAVKKVPGAQPKIEKMSGRINDDGTIFISDMDLKSWKITNPGADPVKSHRNSHVSVNVVADLAHGSVTVRSASDVNEKFSSANP